MVNRHTSLLVCAYLAVVSAVFAQSSYVFQLPGPAQSGSAPQIVGLGDNSFGRIVGPAANANFSGATKVIATPNGAKFYILASGGLFSASSSLTGVKRVSAIGGSVLDAQVSPDGKYLLVVANHLYILNTATDDLAVEADTGVPAGATPVGMAISHDAKTAWVLANATTGSTVTAVDLTTFQAAPNQLALLSGGSSIVLSPRGLLYVTTSANKLFEIDPISLTVTTLGQISVPGQAGPLQFTPDGNTAYFVNRTSCGNCSPFFQLNVQAHALSTWLPSNGGIPPIVDQVLVAGNNRVFAISSATTQLWDITPTPLALTPTIIGALPTSNVVAAAVSDESPSSRYLYLLFSDHNFDRVSLGTNGVDQQSTLDPIDGLILSFVSIPAQSGAASLSLLNVSQTLTPGATAVLIGQLLDAVGRPVMGASASFSADPAAGIAITNPLVFTTAGGWAQTTITAPANVGNFSVGLSVPGVPSANFLLNVNTAGSGGSSGGSGTPQMSIYAGDGELLRQNGSTLDTQMPLTVKIVDADGHPIPNVVVTFQRTEGIGSITVLNQGLTDENGLARANYLTGALPSNNTLQLSKVVAASVYGSVEFFEVTHDATFNALKQPNATLVTPSQTRTITIPQGGLLPAGLATQAFTGNGQLIPNVGLRLADPAHPTANSPIVACVGLSRSDSNGISRCDVQVLPGACDLGTGDFGAFLEVGELIPFSLTIKITQGKASLIAPVTALNQTGNPGAAFTMVATITDGCGQPVAVNGLTWGLLQGSAAGTLSQVQTSSDSGGNVSAKLTLGQTAGVVQVQLSGSGLTPIVFKITNQISLSGISLVSGGGQSGIVGQAFPQPVVFILKDTTNKPVQGALVNFSVTAGSASVSPGSATTNALGQAQTTVTAGATAGSIVVTATASSLTSTATLSSHAAGPQVTTTSFTNAASGAVGMTPCGLVTVTGSGIAPGVQGTVLAANGFGAFPTTFAGVSIAVNAILVPIQSVANDAAGQHATFQAPCELTGTSATVVVSANGASSTVPNVLVASVQPGIFTNLGTNNKGYGAVIREVDGTYVTAANPARQGELVYVVVTGLGQTTPALTTSSVGIGSQTVNLPTAVFLSGRGLPGVSARYLFGSIGSYLVEFRVPSDSAIGADQSLLVIETSADGLAFLGVSNTVLVPAVQ